MESEKPKIVRKKEIKEPEVIEFSGKEVKVSEKEETAFQQQLRQEEEDSKKLPIDKLVDIANRGKLLRGDDYAARWNYFIKGIRLHDITYDSIQSSLNVFSEEYNKKYPEQALSFKLTTRKDIREGGKVKEIFGVTLRLEMTRYGSTTVLLQKHISFQHVKQVKEEANWKYALYGAMYNGLIGIALTHLLLQDDINTGRIKSEVPA